MLTSWLMTGALAFSAPAPIPAARAFELPPATRCVAHRSLTLSLRAIRATTWTGATVKVGGQPFKTVDRAAAKRPVRLHRLPRGRLDLEIEAKTSDGRSAKVERRYQTCIDTRPVIAAPAGEPPKTLQKRDLVTGSVRKARNGDTVTVQYSLVTWSDGKARDSSWDRGAPFSFPLGAGQVIPGFDQGIKGMKVGGRRELVIPPDLGYGDDGAGDVIKPGETLLYVVDLVAIDPK
jgi:peptidylprolyl isomerase